MKFICGVLVAFFVVSSDSYTPFTKCQRGAPPTKVRVANCTKTPCSIARNANLTAEWDFKMTEDTQTLKLRTHIKGSWMNFPVKNACSTLENATCPLVAGQNVTYKQIIPELRYYPPIPLTIEFALLDDKNNVVVCFQLTGKVVNRQR